VTPEIRAFEYATGLFAVLIGLAVVDLATSFHRLLRSKAAVRWDPLALMAALYALCLVVAMWFDLWGVRNFGATRNFLFYLTFIAEFLILFLVAAASLPDQPSEEPDLRAYYAHTRRYLWILLTLFQILYVADGIYFSRGETGRMPAWAVILLNVIMFLPLLISIILLIVKSRRVHYVGLGLLFAVMLLHYGAFSIN
jgi:glycopeptide antibiotics resistance protein